MYLDFQNLKKNLEFFFYHFFCNIKKYDCAKFYVKSIFLSGFATCKLEHLKIVTNGHHHTKTTEDEKVYILNNE